jgi:uncharacterized protein
MAYFALIYEGVEGYLEKRAPFREAHLALVRAAHARGEIIMAGALGKPDGSLLVFRAESEDPVGAFARSDPYVLHGMVRQWTVRPWTVAVGGDPRE